MKLHLFRYECKNCENTFKSPQLIGDAYGEFLMRSRNGDIVYLNTFEDKVFDEVEIIFKKIVSSAQSNNTRLFQSIFSVSCDSSPEDSAYNIRQKPICPSCGESNIGHWGPTNPPEYLEEDIKAVAHERWNKLTSEEKKSLVDEAINSYFSQNR
jgi:hypothetical protein